MMEQNSSQMHKIFIDMEEKYSQKSHLKIFMYKKVDAWAFALAPRDRGTDQKWD